MVLFSINLTPYAVLVLSLLTHVCLAQAPQQPRRAYQTSNDKGVRLKSETNYLAGSIAVDTSIGRTIPSKPDKRTLDSLRFVSGDTIHRSAGSTVFGASLFEQATLPFEPNLRIATPRNYILGPDDEITVDISGAASAQYRLKVTPEGAVKVPNIPPIGVSGLSVEQAERRIVHRLRTAGYQGLGVPGSGIYAHVWLTNIRSIRVTLVSEVRRPGTYIISSLGSAFNALYLAGGPQPQTGSFRRISVIRNDREIRTIDLYDFILRGDLKDNIRLQDDDVIRVADYQTRVEIVGEVRRPAYYEVLPGETLQRVLSFAGGFTDEAYRRSVTVRRNTARERRIITLNEEQIASFYPQPGDRCIVGRILNRYENRVQVVGAVMRPGDYALEPGIRTVQELISRAEGLRPDAFLNRAHIFRESEDMERENLAFDLAKLLKKETADIPLMRQDCVVIQSIRDLREPYYVSIEGAVNKPDTFAFVQSMKLADLIAMAGGFQEGASANQIEVARRIRQDSASTPNNVIIQRFNLNRELSPGSPTTDVALEPFDVVYVRTVANYQPQQQVYIDGEVQHAGKYAILNRTGRISDIIQRAGDLKPGAYLPGAQFRRMGQVIATDLKAILANPTISTNLLLENKDSLYIPRRSELVQIEGAVLNPAAASYKTDFNLDYYISQAGGYTEEARPNKTYVIYPNGMKDRTRRFLWIKRQPRVDPGSVIIVPFKPISPYKITPGERIAMFSTVSSYSTLPPLQLTNVPFYFRFTVNDFITFIVSVLSQSRHISTDLLGKGQGSR